MQFEVIRKSHKKSIVIGASLLIILGVVLIARFTFAKYELVKSIKIAEGTINYKVPDFKMLAMYKNDGNGDIEIDSMPETGYAINETKSYCTLDNINKDTKAKLYTDLNGNHIISGLSKNDKCYLYFDNYKKVNTALGEITVKLATPDFSKTSCSEGCGEATVGIYQARDDDGMSYYYRGDVTNNYIKFGGFYWRIIRINGDGTIRMIYQGTEADGVTSAIGISAFNSVSGDNAYVGFMYGTPGSNTYFATHENKNSSTIKTFLDDWYTTNLISYQNYMNTNAGFCNDRQILSGYGYGTNSTDYAGKERRINSTPTFVCGNITNDLFTLKNANKGNKALTYPIGLITSDEAIYAGTANGASNYSFYLSNRVDSSDFEKPSSVYWTMTPCYMRDLYYLGSGGYSGVTGGLSYQKGVRPVINLRADTKFTFSGTGEKGTISNPYIVS